MYKKFVTIILIFGVLTFTTVVGAEIKTFEGVGLHYMEDENETLSQAQEKAKLAAELAAMEQAQVNIKDYSEMHNSNLTRDEIIAITAGVINVVGVKYSLKEEFGVMLMRAEVTAEIDTDKIPEFIEREINRRESQK